MSQGVIDQLKTAFDVYSTNPNAAKQVVAASAQGQPTGLKGLAAAAALQQAPQAQATAPQGTVMQHLAQQQGIMGQLPAMQGQLASAPPPQEMGMAGGGLVSFAEGGVLPPDVLDAIQEHFAQGGVVRGFPTGGSLQALSSMIPDAPGYFESGDIIDQDSASRRQELYEREAAKKAAEKAALREREIIEGFRRRPSPHVSESISNPPTEPSAYQQRAGMSPYELPKEAPPARGPRGLDPSKLSKEAQEFLTREIPVAEKLKELPKIGKKLGRFKPGPLGVALDAGFMLDTLLDPEFQKQYAEDWKEYMPSWMGGRGAPQDDKKPYTLPQEGMYSIPQGGIRLPQKSEDYADIMRGEAGETFPGAGLASLKQVDKQKGKQEPSTGATVTPRAQPIPEAKEAGYKPPEDQTIETNRQGASAPEGTSSLMPGESYGIPSLGGLEGQVEMLDKLRGLKDMKMSEEQAKRLEEMQTGAKEDKWLGALMGMISGTLGSSSPYLGQAIGQGGIQALAAYQQGAKDEEDIARKAFDIYGQEEQAPRLEHARNVEEIMKLLGKKAELASEERRAANRGGLSYGERSALQTQRDTAAEARARLYGEHRDITNREATARQSADTEYTLARDNGENPNYIAILEKYRRQLGLAEGGLGGGPLGGSGGLTVTRQGISR